MNRVSCKSQTVLKTWESCLQIILDNSKVLFLHWGMSMAGQFIRCTLGYLYLAQSSDRNIERYILGNVCLEGLYMIRIHDSQSLSIVRDAQHALFMFYFLKITFFDRIHTDQGIPSPQVLHKLLLHMAKTGTMQYSLYTTSQLSGYCQGPSIPC